MPEDDVWMEAQFACPHCAFRSEKIRLGVPLGAIRFLDLAYWHLLGHEPIERRDDPQVRRALRQALADGLREELDAAAGRAIGEALIWEWGGSEN
jgi:hypothetical protein